MTDSLFVGDNDHGDNKPVEHDWKAIAEGLRAYCRALETQIQNIKNGFEGCCHACEPVGELNKKLQDDIQYLNKTISEVCEERDELFEKYEQLVSSSSQDKMPSPFIIGGEQDDPLFMASCVIRQHSYRHIKIDIEWTKTFTLWESDIDAFIDWLTKANLWIKNDKNKQIRMYQNDPSCSWMNAFTKKE